MVGKCKEKTVERKHLALAFQPIVHHRHAPVLNPVSCSKVHCLSTIEAVAKACMIGLRKGNNELPGLLPRLIHGHVVTQERRRRNLSGDVVL